jgi:hypothetical protein
MRNHSSRSLAAILLIFFLVGSALTGYVAPEKAWADEGGGVPVLPIQQPKMPDTTSSDTSSTYNSSSETEDISLLGQIVIEIVELIY